jgi:hypothetical protein
MLVQKLRVLIAKTMYLLVKYETEIIWTLIMITLSFSSILMWRLS